MNILFFCHKQLNEDRTERPNVVSHHSKKQESRWLFYENELDYKKTDLNVEQKKLNSAANEYATGHVFKVLCPLQNHIRSFNLD